MQYWGSHAAQRAILCAIIGMGTFPFYGAPVQAAPTSTSGLTYTEETDNSGTSWYTFTSGTSTGPVTAVSGDHLKFSGVTVAGNITINASDTDSSSVRNSAVCLDHTEAGAYIYAGLTVEGDVTGNSAVITGNSIVHYGVYAGRTDYGNASNNVVSINDSRINTESTGSVIGGLVRQSGSASENKVSIDSSTVSSEVGGALIYRGNGNAVNNTVRTNASEIRRLLYGAYVRDSGDVSGNTVIASDSTLRKGVYGAFTASGTATRNSVSISSSSLLAVVGGETYEGVAVENSVSLTDSTGLGARIEEAYGGIASYGKAVNNTLTAINTKLDVVSGGLTLGGTVTENTVELISSDVGIAYGGQALDNGATENEISDNSLTIVSSAVSAATGGYAQAGNVEGNTMTLTHCTQNDVYDDYGFYGGVVLEGIVAGNTLTITSSSLTQGVYGGFAGEGSATGNILAVASSAVTGGVYGGYTWKGSVSGNMVSLSSSRAGNVYGGYSVAYSEASDILNNTITLSTSSVGDVYGGYTRLGNATDNTLTLCDSVDAGNLYGGYSEGSGDVVTGNTLNVTGLNNQAASVRNFDTMNFYVPAGVANGDTMLTVSGTTTIPSTGLTATAYVNGSVVLNPGDEITLLSGAIDTTDGTLATAVSGTVYQGVSRRREALIKTRTENDSGDYIKLIVSESGDTTLDDQTKSVAETPAYTAALAAGAGDFLVDSALWNAAKAVKLNSDRTWTPFAATAYHNMRYNTGSHVESDGWNTILGIARRFEEKSGSFLVGPFVEYGNGDYDSYIDGGIHANGNAHYIGGGIFAQKNFNSGWYIDGSVRGGRMSADYNSNDLLMGTERVHENYDYRTPYYGFHLGFGKVHGYGDNVRLDTYLRYLYAHQNSFDAKLATGENYEFDDVDSSKIRVGTRYIHDEKDLGSWYVGSAYQYEFDNESTAHFDGGDTPSPSIQGSSGMMELGWEGKGGKNVIYDLSLRGWFGKQEGASVKALVKWTF